MVLHSAVVVERVNYMSDRCGSISTSSVFLQAAVPSVLSGILQRMRQAAHIVSSTDYLQRSYAYKSTPKAAVACSS